MVGTGLATDPAITSLFTLSGALVAVVAAASLVRARARRARSPVPDLETPLRVYQPRAFEDSRRTSIEGVVRLASDPCVSPIRNTACAAFGLSGSVSATAIDDAEGGDFDVELESGERVHVSLEHAVLRASEPLSPEPVAPTAELDGFLDARGVGPGREDYRFAELPLRDGDVVEVEGVLSAATAVTIAYHSGAASRVVSGNERAPVVITVRTAATRRS